MGSSTKNFSEKKYGDNVRAILSEESLYQVWMDVEAALALAQVELGIVPSDAADEIARKAKLSYLDLNEVRKKGAAMKHYPLAVIKTTMKNLGRPIKTPGNDPY